MCGVTKKDKIRNESVRGTTRVTQASKKITETQLKCYGHVTRRYEEHTVKRVLLTDIPGRIKKGRPKTRWKDACKGNVSTVGFNTVEAISRMTWGKITSHTDDPT